MSPLMFVTGGVADVIQYAVPTTGQTVVINTGTSALVLNNGGLLATLTVTLPASPVDGQRIVIASGAGITILSIGGNGAAVSGTVATLSISGYVRYIYSATANSWFRSG